MSCKEFVENCCLCKGFNRLLFIEVKLSRNISPSMLFFFGLPNCGTAEAAFVKTHSKWLPAFSVENDWKMCTVPPGGGGGVLDPCLGIGVPLRV